MVILAAAPVAVVSRSVPGDGTFPMPVEILIKAAGAVLDRDAKQTTADV